MTIKIAAIEDRSAGFGCSANSIKVNAQHFSVFHEVAGNTVETVETTTNAASELYQELYRRHALENELLQLRMVVNAKYRGWHELLSDGDCVAFIPTRAD